MYDEMVSSFPSVDLFTFRSELGGKSSLSSRFDKDTINSLKKTISGQIFINILNQMNVFLKF